MFCQFQAREQNIAERGIIMLDRAIAFALAFMTTTAGFAQPAPPGITDVGAFKPAETVAGDGKGMLAAAANPAKLLAPEAWNKMRAYSDAHGGAGLIVLIDGKVVGEAYRPGMTAATQTLSQSMHKSVVGLAYGAAIRDGIITSVDDPAGKYIAEWKDDPRGKIPLKAFLTMTSGLKNFSMARREPESVALVMGKDIDGVALATPLAGTPGAVFAYKNVDAQIAGIALQRAIMAKTGKRYAAWLSDVLWQPLGNGPALLWLDHDGGSPHFFAWLDTDLHSWARVGELIRNHGRAGGKQVLPAQWIAAATAPSLANPGYGYFIWRGSPWNAQRRYSADNPITVTHSAPYAVDDLVFFDGFGGQRVYVSPSKRLVIARSGDTDMVFDDAMLPNLALAGMKK